jgi:cell division cycle 14
LISDSSPPRNKPNSFYFCIDSVSPKQELVYEPFCSDFGPLNIGMTYKYCTELERLMKNREYEGCKIIHYTSQAPNKRANSAVLMGAFQIIVLGRTANQAWEPFNKLKPFTDFRDASFGGCTYKCRIIDVLRGLEQGIKLGWFDYSTFNLSNYEHNEKVENGDFNWIIPGKFLAFSSPSPESADQEGWRTWTPEDYVPVFKRLGVTSVVRLNNKTYDAERFTRLGIKHHDLYFLDGSCPSEAIVRRFLHIAENEEGGLAVHCKAGLGRTGTLICCYAMKHFNFPAPDFIGWIRLCRPGSVLGPQQQFLCEIESKCKRWGSELQSTDAVLAAKMSALEVREDGNLSPAMSPRKP